MTVHGAVVPVELELKWRRTPGAKPAEWTVRHRGYLLMVRKHRSMPGYVSFIDGSNPIGRHDTVADAALAAELEAHHRAEARDAKAPL
jgi:hypothetical protein